MDKAAAVPPIQWNQCSENNKLLIHSTWINLKRMAFNERNQTQNATGYCTIPFTGYSGKIQRTRTETLLGDASTGYGGGGRGLLANGHEQIFRGDTTVLYHDCGGDHVTPYDLSTLQRVNLTACKLYLNTSDGKY